jgi:hypothetical protein
VWGTRKTIANAATNTRYQSTMGITYICSKTGALPWRVSSCVYTNGSSPLCWRAANSLRPHRVPFAVCDRVCHLLQRCCALDLLSRKDSEQVCYRQSKRERLRGNAPHIFIPSVHVETKTVYRARCHRVPCMPDWLPPTMMMGHCIGCSLNPSVFAFEKAEREAKERS